VATALGLFLILDMHRRNASAFHFARRARDVEGAAPTRIDVYEQR
jgi:hypothetical protein